MTDAHDPILHHGPLELGLAPTVGGAVRHFRVTVDDATHDLFRPATAEALAREGAGAAAMFPLVPFANRIRDNRFEVDGVVHHLAANVPGEPLNVHGDGWQSPWRVSDVDQATATLELGVDDPTRPHRYRAFQRFRLEAMALVVEIGVENRGPERMPFGVGLHPYLQRDRAAGSPELFFESRHVWLEGPLHLPTERIATPPELAFDPPRPLPDCWRNMGHEGWGGSATIRWRERGLRLDYAADPVLAHLMLFTPPDADFFCLEPQSHAVDAFSRPSPEREALGTHLLAPGDHLTATARFSVTLGG